MTAILTDRHVDYTWFSGFCGIGGQTLGALHASARVGNVLGRFRAIGAIDSDPGACRAYEALTGARATCRDLFSVEQYAMFHGRPPPEDWAEFTPDDLREAAGGEFPDVASVTAPCKGFSGLNAHRSTMVKYVALNRLTVRMFELMLRAWADRPPRLILLENVPGIASRGRPLLDAIESLLRHHGYVVTGYTHDCGELGGLAQHRERYLLVARHRASVPPFLYEPAKRAVRAVGEVLEGLPLPEAEGSGVLHRVPRLNWKTWVRLALIEAGKDWRSLASLPVEDGFVRGLGLVPGAAWHQGVFGVTPWNEPACTVTGRAGVTTGAFSVADPRPHASIGDHQPYGVNEWDEPARTVTAKAAAGSGPYSVADPRYGDGGLGQHAKMRVEQWEEPAHTVTGSDRVGSGALSIADPRPPAGWAGNGKYRITGADEPAGAVISESGTGNGAFALADPRVGEGRFNNVYRLVRWDERSPAVTGGGTPSSGGLSVADPRIDLANDTGFRRGYYGVVPWADPSGCVTGSACHDNGAWTVADPRVGPFGPDDKPEPYPMIVALDGTWHRPFTTLELAALQGFLEVVPAAAFTRALVEAARRRTADSLHRAWIGNAIPPEAAKTMGATMIHTLLLADAGVTFVLSSAPIWVDRRLAVALAVEAP